MLCKICSKDRLQKILIQCTNMAELISNGEKYLKFEPQKPFKVSNLRA